MKLYLHEGCLQAFVVESNRIEGLHHEGVQLEQDIDMHRLLLFSDPISLAPLRAFVMSVAGAELRNKPGMNVMIGNHLPPAGGPRVERELIDLLRAVADPEADPWRVHCEYETLHPFMDGNGRSGRALWAWMMLRRGYDLRRGFLHEFYYQTLDRAEGRRS